MSKHPNLSVTNSSENRSENSSSGSSKGKRRYLKWTLEQCTKYAAGLPLGDGKARIYSNIFERVAKMPFQKDWVQTFHKLTHERPVKPSWHGATGAANHAAAQIVKHIDHLGEGQYQIVDFGCGDGLKSTRLGEMLDLPVLHVDTSDFRCEEASKKGFFITTDKFKRGAELTFPTILLCSMSLHHCHEGPRVVLAELLTNLPPQSYVVVIEHQCAEQRIAIQLDFEHFLYQILEGTLTQTWSNYESDCRYLDFPEAQEIIFDSCFVVHSSRTTGGKYLIVGRNFRVAPSSIIPEVEVQEPSLKQVLAGKSLLDSPLNTNVAESTMAGSGGGEKAYVAGWNDSVANSSGDSEACPPMESGDGGWGGSDDPGPNPPPQPPTNRPPNGAQEPGRGLPPEPPNGPGGGGGGGPPVPPNVPIGPNVPPPQPGVGGVPRAIPDLRDHVRGVPVQYSPELGEGVARALRLRGANPGPVVTGCAHPAAAAYRALCVRSAIKRAIPKGALQFTLLDYFGGNRNRQAFGRPALPLRLDIVPAPDTAVQGDAAREFFRDAVPNGYDSFIVQDVYQDGYDYKAAMCPAILLTLVDGSRRGSGYVMLRNFCGMLGQDSDLYDEAMWVRDTAESDMIHFSPDPTGVSYGLHPDCQWLFKYRSFQGLSIADVAQFGPYKLFCVARDPEGATALSPQLLSCGSNRVEAMRFDQDDGSLLSIVARNVDYYLPALGLSEPEAVEWVDTRIYAAKAPLYATKVTTPQSRDSATSAVHSELSSLLLYRRLRERFPAAYLRVAQGTIRAVLFGQKAQATRAAEYDAVVYRPFNDRLVAARAGNAEPWYVKYAYEMLAGVGLCALLALRVKISGMDVGKTIVSQAQYHWNRYVNHGPRVLENAKVLVEEYQASPRTGWLASNWNKWQHRMAEFFDSVVWSPLFEETCRWLWPRFALGLTLVVEPLQRVISGQYFAALMSLLFHTIMTLMTPRPEASRAVKWSAFTTRWGIHTAWNFAAFFTNPCNQYSLQRDEPVFCPMSVNLLSLYSGLMGAAATVPLQYGAFWPAVSGRFLPTPIRPEAEASLSITIDGNQTTLQDAAVFLEAFSHETYIEKNRVYPLVTLAKVGDSHSIEGIQGHVYCFARPSTSPINLLNCLVHRTMAEPRVHPLPGVWQELHEYCRELFFLRGRPLGSMYTFFEAVRNMDTAKRMRLMAAYSFQEKYGVVDAISNSISVKHNEVLPHKEEPMLIKPRAIVQLSPESLALATALNHTVTDYLHDCWSPTEVYYIEHFTGVWIPVVFVFASGYTSDMLDQLFAYMESQPDLNFYVVAGDDNYTRFGANPVNLVGVVENDFSQYDSTQGPDALEGDTEDMKAMGLTEEQAELETRCTKLPFRVMRVVQGLSIVIKFKTEPQQLSGRGSTTWGNSGRNIKDGVHLFRNLGRATPTELAAELGFLLKSRFTDQPDTATFLKGWFCRTHNGSHHWLPLPSMILKVAKLLRHPRELSPGYSDADAYKRALYALAKSPGYIPPEYPIAGPFIQMMLRLGQQCDLELSHKKFRIVVTPFCDTIDVERMLDKIHMRYGIEPDEVSQFHSLLQGVSTLPILLISPLMEKLMFDYE